MNDNRSAQRIPTERPVTLSINEKKLDGKMIDLSVEGTRILVKSECEDSGSIELEFNLYSFSDTVTMSGEIIHKNKVRGEYLIGISFNDGIQIHRGEIKKFIQQH